MQPHLSARTCKWIPSLNLNPGPSVHFFFFFARGPCRVFVLYGCGHEILSTLAAFEDDDDDDLAMVRL